MIQVQKNEVVHETKFSLKISYSTITSSQWRGLKAGSILPLLKVWDKADALLTELCWLCFLGNYFSCLLIVLVFKIDCCVVNNTNLTFLSFWYIIEVSLKNIVASSGNWAHNWPSLVYKSDAYPTVLSRHVLNRRSLHWIMFHTPLHFLDLDHF